MPIQVPKSEYAPSSAGFSSPSKPASAPLFSCVDGNSALAHVAFGVSDVALVYPAAAGDNTGTALHKLAKEQLPNCFGNMCQVANVDTKPGAASTALGSLSTGALSTVFATSQSITAMLPNLHKLTIDRKSAVFHVSASGVDKELMQTPDYSDVMRAVHTGFAMIHSNSVQECHDLALVAHLASAKVSLPFMHFYDGTRTAHEVAKTQLIPYSKLARVAELLEDKDLRPDTIPKKRIPDVVDELLSQMRRIFKRRYRLFEYSGPTNADFLVVSLCSQTETSALTHAAAKATARGKRVGVLQIRLLRPWSARHFLQCIPLGTLKRMAVVVGAQQDASASTILFSDVVSSIPLGHAARVLPANLPCGIDLASASLLVDKLSDDDEPASLLLSVEECEALSSEEAPALREDIKSMTVWDVPEVGAPNSTVELAQVLGESSSLCTHAMQQQDTYNVRGHVVSTQLHVSSTAFAPPASTPDQVDYVVVNNTQVLDMFDVLAGLSDSGLCVVNSSADTQDIFEATLPGFFRKQLAVRKLKLFAVDFTKFEHTALAQQLTVLLLSDFLGQSSLVEAIDYIRNGPLAFSLAHHHEVESAVLHEMVEEVGKALRPVNVPEAWVAEILAEDAAALPKRIAKCSFVRERTELPVPAPRAVTPWHTSAQHLLFPNAFEMSAKHRPQDGPKDQSFIIKLKKNLRVTPDDYDRNVFHLEMDISGTGLTYGIGDALGIYARNPAAHVKAFMEMYGLDGDNTVTVRSRESGMLEVTTVENVLTQRMDMFGRPSKGFYTALAAHAEDAKEKEMLEKLSSKEGNELFKKRVEATTTFADLLKEFKSARPSFTELMAIVPDMKPRHYSIASAQSMHPTEVHLLIVLVEWTTPSGEKRFGQATQYLVDLEVGAEISVCVKPSVMKLPKDPMAPVVMAGLGTGMAPFRAFIEERAWQAAQGMKVGPMSLYFGSRSMFQEYLYGDELEAYNASGLLTNLRCAFSRDGPKKVYIQHKIQADAKQLFEYLGQTNGQFYLCGPTWPAGDVQDAITAAFTRFGGMDEKEAAKAVNDLKEEERYILEVY